ncbi:MAG: DUF885 family protein [Gemmatimonas sp.]
MRRSSGLIVLLLMACSATARAQDSSPAPLQNGVPSDLRPLLTPKKSETRLVVTRYGADRTMLAGNYAGAAGNGRGGGAFNAAVNPMPGAEAAAMSSDSIAAATITISTARIARLKRFDLSWQTAINALSTTTLTPVARQEMDSLSRAIRQNLSELDSATAMLANAMPLTTFAPKVIDLIENRIRIKDINSEVAAGTLTEVTKDIAAMRAKLAAAQMQNDAGAFKPSRRQALSAASAVDAMRNNLSNWFTFYNGYDPLFTWWMGLPYKKVDVSMRAYSAYLRDTLAYAPTSGIPAQALTIAEAPASKFGDVPNLKEIIALPQDEMTDIVARFLGRGQGGGRGGNGGGGGRGNGGGNGSGNGGGTPVTKDSTYYHAWLVALNTLDFDKLSRNAQVDYLYLKKFSELQISHGGVALAANPPRKTDNSGIPGAARGRDGLIRDLQDELIPYTPEQLIALAEKEFAWCDAEMLKASRQMGFGENWKAALEKTKTMHPPPGGQPAMIRDLIFQAIDYLRLNDLVTVPTAAAESQRMVMMSPERQIVNPFFTGGAQISVSYPTDEMEFDAREQSMRGNNRPWSHATAFHEMIPGHNLVGFYGSRYGGYRANLGTSGPFFGEGWPLYWELTLYDKGFDVTPEERVGALFWRMHRCARIIFSLKFHMGQWSPQEAVDFLVDRVGHERENAMAEVRRSFQGGYGPLYQAAYLLGGLQLRGLRRELVDTKKMSEKAFHDEILRQGSMPIALLKLALSQTPLKRDQSIDWKFYGDLPDK